MRLYGVRGTRGTRAHRVRSLWGTSTRRERNLAECNLITMSSSGLIPFLHITYHNYC